MLSWVLRILLAQRGERVSIKIIMTAPVSKKLSQTGLKSLTWNTTIYIESISNRKKKINKTTQTFDMHRAHATSHMSLGERESEKNKTKQTKLPIPFIMVMEIHSVLFSRNIEIFRSSYQDDERSSIHVLTRSQNRWYLNFKTYTVCWAGCSRFFAIQLNSDDDQSQNPKAKGSGTRIVNGRKKR